MNKLHNTFESRGGLRRPACWGMMVVCLLLAVGCGSAGKGSSKSGEDAFDTAIDRPPTSKTLYTMARILVAQNRDGEAEFVLVRILKNDPDYIPAYVAVADLQVRSHKTEEAIKTLNAGLARSPGDAVILNNLGMIQVTQADYASALDYFNRAIQADPRSQKLAGNRAMALGMMGRYDESLASYNEIVKPSDSHYNLAVLCDARGDRERAATEYAQAALLKAKEKEAVERGETVRPIGRRAPLTESAEVAPPVVPESMTTPVAAPAQSAPESTPSAAADTAKEPTEHKQ